MKVQRQKTKIDLSGTVHYKHVLTMPKKMAEELRLHHGSVLYIPMPQNRICRMHRSRR